MGLEAIGKQLDKKVVFRLDQFKEVTGLKREDTLTSKTLAKVFCEPKGLFKGTPMSATRVAFLNKLDLLTNDREVKELAELLLQGLNAAVDRVVVGSIEKKHYLAFAKEL